MWLIMGTVIVLGLLLSAFFSGAETGLYCVNRLRVELGVQQQDPRAKRLARLLEDEQGSLSVMLIGTNVANYVTTTAVAVVLAELVGLDGVKTELYTVAALTPIVFVFGEVVPKNLLQRFADELLPRASALLSVFDKAFRITGMVWLLKKLAALVNRIIGGAAKPTALIGPKWRIAHLLKEALAAQDDESDQLDLIHQVCDLSETPVHAVMVPRNRVRAIAAHADRRELERQARRSRHARFCVYEGRHRHVLGVVQVDTLLRDTSWTTVQERLEQVPTLSPHETVVSALHRLRRTGRSMAVVADASGRMLGIVTFADLLRELIGDVASNGA